MGYRVIVIATASKLSLKNKNFLYSPIDGKSISVPIEDISVIVLETHQVSITNALLAKLSELNIVLFSCDEKHIPCGVYLPFHQHSRYSLMAHLQSSWSEPFKKQIWQKIIIQKIKNQAYCLRYSENENYKYIETMALYVKSGDSTNVESSCAKAYFEYLFAPFNRRDEEDWRNKALNYGYSLIRGAIARSLVSYGFIPAFGLHHKNQLNAFNLADDIIEPFRAFVDVVVWEMYQESYVDICERKQRFIKEDKNKLYEFFSVETIIDGHKTTLLNACDIVVQSLSNATKEKDSTELLLPSLDIDDEKL